MNVELRKIEKRFGAVHANAGVDLDVTSGEVLALLGENGAGKSTLMKILYGLVRPDSGEIRVEGKRVELGSPRRARELGVGMVFQHFSLIPALTVAENLVLGAPGVPWALPLRGQTLARSVEQLRALLPGVDVTRTIADLSVGEQQLVELAKVLAAGAKLVILDEPTSVLSKPEAEALYERVRELARRGHAVILITHKLVDVAACADRVAVMRSGRVAEITRAVHDRSALIRAMLGDEIAARCPGAARTVGPVRLHATGVRARSRQAELHALDLEVRAGEIVGVAGVTGNGQELLGQVLAGAAARTSGSLLLDGRELSPGGSEARKVAYIPEQPLENGAAKALSLLGNLYALELPRLPFFPDLGARRRRAGELLARFDVRPPNLDLNAGALSGGNVQKLVVARELSRETSLVVACFPTMGLDVHAAAAVCAELARAAERGAAVVWISEDLDTLLEHADRIAVMHRGRLRGPVAVRDCSFGEIGAWMTGAAA